MTASNEAFIICENLVKIFKVGEVEVLALQGLDLTIKQGELIGVVGASGSGKSTLINVLGGLVVPSAGKAIVDGQNLLKLSGSQLDHYRKSQVGFVWQQGSRNLIPYLSALDNVKLPLILSGRAGHNATKRARYLLDLVDLQDRYHHKPIQLSGGQQQQVAIAIALANEPSLLLADEPTGDLDSATADQVYDLFRKLNGELGLTIIIVSHDPMIAQHVGRVVAIRDGKTASETVRRQTISDETQLEQFEELIVLDSAGRLQIPAEYREQLAIHNRVQMEVQDDALVIRPAQNLEETSSQSELQIAHDFSKQGTNTGILSKLQWWKRQK